MPPVARPETICWIRMSILSGGERAPLLPHAPPPLRDSRCAVHLLVPWWLICPASTDHRWVVDCFIGWAGGGSWGSGWFSVSEIGAADGVVLFELGGGARHHHAAGLEEIGVVGQVEG